MSLVVAVMLETRYFSFKDFLGFERFVSLSTGTSSLHFSKHSLSMQFVSLCGYSKGSLLRPTFSGKKLLVSKGYFCSTT